MEKGWTQKVMAGKAGAPGSLPRIVRNGTNNLLTSGTAWNRIDFGDGGFALIGFRREALAAIDDVFGAIAWGSPTVMSSTRDQLLRAGLRWTELATLVDIDEPADLEHVPKEWLVRPVSGDSTATERT